MNTIYEKFIICYELLHVPTTVNCLTSYQPVVTHRETVS